MSRVLAVTLLCLFGLQNPNLLAKTRPVRSGQSDDGRYSRAKPDVDLNQLSRDAILLGRGGQYNRALKKFFSILDIQEGKVAKTYNNIGYLYELKGDFIQAINFYKKSLGYNAKLVEPTANLGRLYFIRKMWANAVQLGEAALKLQPDHKEVRRWLPIAYERLLEEKKSKILGRESGIEQKKKTLIKPNFSSITKPRPVQSMIVSKKEFLPESSRGSMFPIQRRFTPRSGTILSKNGRLN